MDVKDAFTAIDRRDFLPEEFRSRAGEDRPFPIGYGQTNSQPFTVRQMLEWLDVEAGQAVLDVGSGSGWTTALLAKIVGDNGHVYAVEIVPELVELGEKNCAKYDLRNVEFYAAQKQIGLPGFAPFDRILVSAGAGKMPDELVMQLKASGKMVIPIGSAIYEVEKDLDGDVRRLSHYGYAFVPLIE